MKRVMVVGGPGAGKSTLAIALGARKRLPVFHMDRIHYAAGWRERGASEKDRLTRAVHGRETWIFEGGHSRTYAERAARADTLVWLDLPVGRRLARLVRRRWTWHGRIRPGMPDGCLERLDFAFLRWTVCSRRHSRRRIATLIAGHPHLVVHHLRSARDVRRFLERG